MTNHTKAEADNGLQAREGESIDSDRFHELAMNYRGARVLQAEEAYQEMIAHIDAHCARKAQAVAAPAVAPIDGLSDADVWRECVTAIRAGFMDSDTARAFIAAHTSATPAAQAAPADAMSREDFIEQIILSVAEIPDRDSPEDQPEMMLVTDKELRGIVESALETADEMGGLAGSMAAPADGVRDTERLDFIADHGIAIRMASCGTRNLCVWGAAFPEPQATCRENLRAAIDALRSQQSSNSGNGEKGGAA